MLVRLVFFLVHGMRLLGSFFPNGGRLLFCNFCWVFFPQGGACMAEASRLLLVVGGCLTCSSLAGQTFAARGGPGEGPPFRAP